MSPVLGSLVTVLFLLAACASDEVVPRPSPSGPPTVQGLIVLADETVVGQITANLYAGALNANGQPSVVSNLSAGESGVESLVSGQGDLYGAPISLATVELGAVTKTASSSPTASPTASQTPQGQFDPAFGELSNLASGVGLAALDAADASVETTFVVATSLATSQGLTSLSDLAAYSARTATVLGGPRSCQADPYCLPGLESVYGIEVAKFIELSEEPEAVAKALVDGRVQVAAKRSAFGAPKLLDLTVLIDDRDLVPVGNITPLLQDSLPGDGVRETLNRLSSTFTMRALQDMTMSVSKGQDPAAVTDAWLALNGLA